MRQLLPPTVTVDYKVDILLMLPITLWKTLLQHTLRAFHRNLYGNCLNLQWLQKKIMV